MTFNDILCYNNRYINCIKFSKQFNNWPIFQLSFKSNCSKLTSKFNLCYVRVKINKKPSLVESIKIIFKIVKIAFKANKFYFFWAIISTIAISLLPILVSYLFSLIIDNIVQIVADQTVNNNILKYIILYGVTLFAVAVFSELNASIQWVLYKYDMTAYFTKMVTNKFKELDLEFYENTKYTSLKKDALDGYEWRPSNMITDLLGFCEKIFSAIVLAMVVININPIASVALILSLIPSLIVDSKLRSGIWDIWTSDADTRKEYGQLMYINTSVVFFKEIKLLNLYSYFQDKLMSLINRVHGRQKKAQYKRMIGVIITSVFPIAVATYFIYGESLKVLAGITTLGSLTFFVSNLFAFKDASGTALFNFNYVLDQTKYIKAILDFLAIPSKINSKPNAIKIIDCPPSIEFKNVSFKYPGTRELILKDFNFYIAPGEKVAFVGENGAGKTTIMKLILRLYDVSSGAVLINGTDVKDINVQSLRKICGVLLQDFTTFHLPTIQENIGFGNIERFYSDSASNKKLVPRSIISAAKLAEADKFISKNKNKYNEILGREFGGVDLSGGEYQRLALARTFYKDAGIIIMDEPTSNVDAKAESAIFESIKSQLQNKTVVFVSHRFSTVRIADRVIVVENGQIIEDGSHDILVKKDGVYKKMFELQAKGYNS